jgi:UDP-GlcNAc:undecaprenyl-phosphate/decaprenyl-phosphate GlcNAc-1-phosphate transferase
MEKSLMIYGLVAFVISVLVQFLIIDLAHRKGIFMDDHEADLPQKLHTMPTPRIGGLGIFLGLICLIADVSIGRFILISLIPAFIAGFLEDLYSDISPLRRLAIMSFSSFLVIYLLDAYVLDFGIFEAPIWLGILITIIAILGLVNGTNLLDGFNGLSSGISIIILITYALTAYKVGDQSILLVSVITLCAILGFFAFNYPKGRIFLGDGGAYTIGFLLAVIGILIVKNNPDKISPFYAFLCLIYPVWEVIFSFSRRLLAGKSPLHPDSNHIHQLFFRSYANKNNPATSIRIYPIVILFCSLAYFFQNNASLLAASAIVFVIMYSLTYKIVLKKDKANI